MVQRVVPGVIFSLASSFEIVFSCFRISVSTADFLADSVSRFRFSSAAASPIH